MAERLQKLISSYGVASRRGAEELIAAGHVTVNGRVAKLGEKVDGRRDIVEVRGVPLGTQPGKLYVVLNKPVGYVTSLRSTHGERTVLDLVSVRDRLFPVGRLDKETSGLLLLTNDGDWAYVVSHPRYEVEKEYRALVRGNAGERAVLHLREGVSLPGGDVTAPARVHRIGSEGGNSVLGITLVEGKKRQIRDMCAAVGHPVIRLVRVRIGSIPLAGLEEGKWRYLEPSEVQCVRPT